MSGEMERIVRASIAKNAPLLAENLEQLHRLRAHIKAFNGKDPEAFPPRASRS
jgi:hypothetical protein